MLVLKTNITFLSLFETNFITLLLTKQKKLIFSNNLFQNVHVLCYLVLNKATPSFSEK